MNYNGGEMRNMNNGRGGGGRKRKSYDFRGGGGGKRSRFSNGPGPQPQRNAFKNTSWNRGNRSGVRKVSNETPHNPFNFTPPINDYLKSHTSSYEQINRPALLNATITSKETEHSSLFDYVLPKITIDNSYNNSVPLNDPQTSRDVAQNSFFVYKSPTHEAPKTRTSPYDPKNPSTGIYSANNRIKALRQALTAADSDRLEDNSVSSCSNSNSSRCSNPKPCYMGKPSTIQERLKNIKNTLQSSNKPLNRSNETENCNLTFSEVSSSNDPNVSEDESMDWCAFEEKEVLDNITKLRENNSIPKIAPLTTFQQKLSDTLVKMPSNESMYREIFIVIDTNIFLSNLGLIEDLLTLKINISAVCTPCIMIPWTVIQELDYLKDSMRQSTLKNNAKLAIKFINEKLTSHHPQVKGQSLHDAAEKNVACKNADDSILFCCLQIKERQHNPILLSNDINLRNKAIIHGVIAYSHKTIIDGLDPYRDTEDGLQLQPGFDYSKLKAVEVLFSNFFSFVIHTKMLDAYGSSRDVMYPDLKTPPWSLMKCLALLKKFWRPIFSLFLKRQFIYTVNQYIEFLSKHDDLDTMGPSKIKNFVNTGLELFEYIENGCAIYKENVISSRKKVEEITKDFFVLKN